MGLSLYRCSLLLEVKNVITESSELLWCPDSTGWKHRRRLRVCIYINRLSALPRRRGLKQHWHTELKCSVCEPPWHPRILGNAIQAPERSIVRITFVGGKGKLGCTITNCFQILSYSVSKLLPKLSADTAIFFPLFSRIIHSSLKCRISGHPPKSETRPCFLSSHPLPIRWTYEISAPGMILYWRFFDWWKIASYLGWLC